MWRAAMVVAIALGANGCVSVDPVTCADGRLCPHGSKCDDARHRCIAPDQVKACNGLTDGAACTVNDAIGMCVDGACTPPTCGDGIREGAEACDGDDLGGFDCVDVGFYEPAGLACNIDCRFDAAACTGECGDGVINGPEICDGTPPADLSCLSYGFDAGSIGCTPRCVPDVSGCGRLGWTRMPVATPTNLRGVWASSTHDIYVVGQSATQAMNGAALHFDGTAWNPVPIPNLAAMLAVTGTGPSDVFMGGFAMEHWDGTSWTKMTGAGIPSFVYGLAALAPDNVLAVGTNVARYNGSSWSTEFVQSGGSLYAVWPRNAADIWAAGFGGVVVHYDGLGWGPVSGTGASGPLTGVTGLGASEVFISENTTPSDVLHYDGQTWTSSASTFFGVRGLYASHGHVYAGGTGSPAPCTSRPDLSCVYDLAPNGHDFLPSPTAGLTASLNAIAGDPAGHLWAVGDAGVVLAFQGAAWEISDAAGSVIWGSDATHLFSATGRLCKFYSGDAATPATTTCSPDPLAAMWGASATDVYAAGDNGTIVHYGGTSWSPMTSGTTAKLLGLWGSGAADVYAVGTGGTLLHSTGSAWAAIASQTTDDLHGIWGSDANHVFVVGAAGRLVVFDGAQWTPSMVGSGQDLNAVWGTSASDVWIAGDSGSLFHFDGQSWTATQAGTADLGALWGTSTNDIFVGGAAASLFHYDGQRWGAVRMFDAAGTISSIWGDGTRVFFGDGIARSILYRGAYPPTGCSASETRCNDAYDDDCDFLLDCADPECREDPACE